jgi:hypothetical protein
MYRITKVIQNHGYKTMTLQREVLHPNYKSNKLRLRFPYMTVRNNLRSWNSKQEWKQVCHWLVIAYGYLRSGVIQCFG